MLLQPTIFLMITLCFCLLTQVHALSLSHVHHSPRYMDGSSEAGIKIYYTLDQPAQVILSIFDDRELMIRQLNSNRVMDKGEHFFLWQGMDQMNRPVPAEAYHYTLIAENQQGKVEYDVTDQTGGNPVKVSNIIWDKAKQTINYRLSKLARVNLRAGLADNGPLLAMLTDWLPRRYGKHQFNWDGLDNSRTVDLTQLENIEIYAQAFSLSDNTLLVGPSVQHITDIDIKHWPLVKRIRKKPVKKRMRVHHQQSRDKRGDFTVSIVLPADLKINARGLPVIQELTPLRFNIKASDQSRVINDRFEPILFIDGQYSTENEVGFFPMTWNLDPNTLSAGEHYITVNLRGYEGHFGAASVRIEIPPSEKQHPDKLIETTNNDQ